MTTTQSPRFDCGADAANWEEDWRADKKAWCCANAQVGCPSLDAFDCEAGYANWEEDWRDDKKTWCCANKFRGCAIALKFDCSEGWPHEASLWHQDKSTWCCKHFKDRCQLPTTKTSTTTTKEAAANTEVNNAFKYDCDDGEPSSWRWSQKTWCCENADKGCSRWSRSRRSSRLYETPEVQEPEDVPASGDVAAPVEHFLDAEDIIFIIVIIIIIVIISIIFIVVCLLLLLCYCCYYYY